MAAVLTGPAGIGKTALWEWAVQQAASTGYLVLASRAGRRRGPASVGGTHRSAAHRAAAAVLPALPAPQRQALQVVMLQSDGGEVADERAVGTALWSVLAALARSRPVLIALDDLPYLDAASAGALRFALRRIEPAGRVRLVATARGDGSRWAPRGRAARRPGAVARGSGPVTVGALFELLAARLEARLARPVLLRVHATSGGNPLYALELARALARLEISSPAGRSAAGPDQPGRTGRRAGRERAAGDSPDRGGHGGVVAVHRRGARPGRGGASGARRARRRRRAAGARVTPRSCGPPTRW